METKQCKRCHHYIQHYGLKEGRLFPVYCGHCVQGKPKRRLPDADACQQFIPGEADTEAFVTRNYLSKKMPPELPRRHLDDNRVIIFWDKCRGVH